MIPASSPTLAPRPLLGADPAWLAQALERVTLLLPELAPGSAADLPAYALAYVEHYQGDVLQLEREWEFLYAALQHAWHRGADATVVPLVAALAHAAGRLPTFAIAEHVLRLGIAASRRTQDATHLALFLNRLGSLLFAHGKYRQGQEIWHAGLVGGAADGAVGGFWEPFASVVHTANILNNYPAAQHFAGIFLRAPERADLDSLTAAVFIRGFHARLHNDLDQAQTDFSDCLRLLAQQPAAPPSPYRSLFTSLVQAELARVQGHYARAQACAETTIALAQVFGDRVMIVDLLVDQLFFSAQQGQFADAQVLFQRVCDLARQTAVPDYAGRCRWIARRLAAQWPTDSPRPPGAPPALSARELEVLQFVAAGLSNQEIAARLVITPGTVKKHLEHIYTKLDVPSRTAALAQARTLKIAL